MLNNLGGDILQWLCYPQEFRIVFPKYLELSESLEEPDISQTPIPIQSPLSYRNEEELLDMAVDVGTLVWRIQRRLSVMEQLPKELNRISRDIESTWNALSQRSIEIKDHTGQDYVTGMALRVITSQPVTNLTKKQIIETLKPTIYYKEKIVQIGEVIIGVPEENQASDLIESA